MKRTPQQPGRSTNDRRQALQDQLKGAILDLINHMGRDAFYVELSGENGDPFYLVFGQGSQVKQFAATLPEDASPAPETIIGDSTFVH
jgi:hypothetical protein